MFNRFKIDQLLVFFLLSIVFLLLSFGKELIFGKNNSSLGLQKYFEIENAISVPIQSIVNSDDSISVYNPAVKLLYSVNGGQDYFVADQKIVLGEIQNPDLISIPTSYHWRQPIGNFDGCKNIVVQLKNTSDNSTSEKKVYTFFTKELTELPVIALTLPQDDLFSEQKGLMIFGRNADSDEGFYNAWWNRSANFTGRGMEWEKEAFFQYFKEGKLQIEQYCGLRISGNATRGFPQKSMQIVARKMYGDDHFDFSFFNNSGQKKYTSLVIRNSGNDNAKTLFADLLMHRLADESNVLTLKGSPTVVYINGNYWGIYNLRERVDQYFISKIEDVQETEVTILEGGEAELKDGNKSDKADFDRLISKLKNVKDVSRELYNEICQAIDENSFIDYIFFETFFGNNDWPHNNSMWYKAGEGKWKWILNDLDYGLAYLGEENVNTNLFDKLKNSNAVIGVFFTKLYTNAEFEKNFTSRCYDLVTFHLSDKNIQDCYRELKVIYQTEIKKHIGRWRMIKSVEEWENNCTENLNFLIQRKNIYLKQISELE